MAGTETAPRRIGDRVRTLRARVRRTRGGRIAWRTSVTVLGVLVILLGIVLLPIPGPGWLTIFAGLGILATEYAWAAGVLRFARRQVGRWTAWVGRQNRVVQIVIGALGLLFLAALAFAVYLIYA